MQGKMTMTTKRLNLFYSVMTISAMLIFYVWIWFEVPWLMLLFHVSIILFTIHEIVNLTPVTNEPYRDIEDVI